MQLKLAQDVVLPQYSRRLLRWGALCPIVLCWLTGCGMPVAPVGTAPLAPVTGKVTLDGVPLENAIIEFQPTGSPNLATSFGSTNDKGEYSLIYMAGIQGAVVGKHTARIKRAHETKGELLPARYNAKSELTAEVKKGGGPINFDLVSGAGTDEDKSSPDETE